MLCFSLNSVILDPLQRALAVRLGNEGNRKKYEIYRDGGMMVAKSRNEVGTIHYISTNPESWKIRYVVFTRTKIPDHTNSSEFGNLDETTKPTSKLSID